MAKEYGVIIESAPDFKEYGEIIEPFQPSESRENLKKLGKGIYKGALDVPQSVGDVLTFFQESVPTQILKSLGVKEPITPRSPGRDIMESVSALQEFVPEDSSLLSEGARRLTRSLAGAPFGAGAVGGLLGAEAAGLGAKKTAEALGASEGVQETADILGSLLSAGKGTLAKKLSPGKKLQEFVKEARKKGLTEKEITPLIQSEKKLATLSKFAHKGEKTRKLFKSLENKLGDSYELIKKDASKLPRISTDSSRKLYEDFRKIKKDFEKTLAAAPDKKSAISFIDEAMKEIRNKATSPEKLINFWQDINQAVNWNAIKGGKKKIAELKKPILDALQKESPSLAKDFEITNELYAKYKKAAKKLRPEVFDTWLNKSEATALGLGIATGNPSLLKKVAGITGSRILARELLTNPKFQNISNKMLEAIQKNKPQQVDALLKMIRKDLKEKYPKETFKFGEIEEKEK